MNILIGIIICGVIGSVTEMIYNFLNDKIIE